ncbi:hypothetical protein KBY28_08650 [Ruegeria pomeroyi]|uniref:hypothetical protein n=1 Tax=Ruegeria pomeroyi TaxID=89184 RepID=UPI001F2FA87C|nr:hypothetical protein [Ruegeria pomeroyi]MCE8508514.1 hypothetical protein [Ruegeria pomeroyi]
MNSYSVEKIIGVLALLPPMGFVLALTQQYTFLKTVGVEPFDILQIGDLILSSALFVLPMVAFTAVVFAFQGWGDLFLGVPSPAPLFGETGGLYDRIVNFIFFGMIYLTAFLYATLGLQPSIGAFSLYFVVWKIVFHNFISYIALLPRAIALGITVYSLLVVLLAADGTIRAFSVRSGATNSAKVQLASAKYFENALELTRNYSTGALTVNRGEKSILFIDNDGYTLLYPLNTDPPKGLACILFEFCSFSSWTYSKKREPS